VPLSGAELLAESRKFAEDGLVRLPTREARVVAENQGTRGGEGLDVEDMFGPRVAVGAQHSGLNVFLVESHVFLPMWVMLHETQTRRPFL